MKRIYLELYWTICYPFDWLGCFFRWLLWSKLDESIPGPISRRRTDPRSPEYVNPDDYGCKPGIITWDYLNALYEEDSKK